MGNGNEDSGNLTPPNPPLLHGEGGTLPLLPVGEGGWGGEVMNSAIDTSSIKEALSCVLAL